MLRRLYIHELSDWPNFTWRQEVLIDHIAEISHQQGLLLGRMADIGFDLKQEAELNTLTDTIVKTSEIEGEVLNVGEVRSSVASRLGIDIGGVIPSRRNIDGIVDLMIDATGNCYAPLTRERLFGWHAQLFPAGWDVIGRQITVGDWRKPGRGPMRVVSGPPHRERVHFVAPSEDKLEDEMQAFLLWFNELSKSDNILKAALAHLWFVTIHPFDDGNGRLLERLLTWLWQGQMASLNVFTACRLRFAKRELSTTKSLVLPTEVRWT